MRILGCEIEDFLHDSRDRFAMPIGNGKQSKIITLAQKCVGRRHVTARNHRATADRHQVNNHERDGKD